MYDADLDSLSPITNEVTTTGNSNIGSIRASSDVISNIKPIIYFFDANTGNYGVSNLLRGATYNECLSTNFLDGFYVNKEFIPTTTTYSGNIPTNLDQLFLKIDSKE